MVDPRMLMGGPGAALLQQGVGGGGPMGAIAGGIPQMLMPQMQPGASPEQAMGGAMQDPRIAAYIRALSSGGGFGGMGR